LARYKKIQKLQERKKQIKEQLNEFHSSYGFKTEEDKHTKNDVGQEDPSEESSGGTDAKKPRRGRSKSKNKDESDGRSGEVDSGSTVNDDDGQGEGSNLHSADESDGVEDKKAVKKEKKFKPKTQAYDRENETHKKIFTEILKEVAPDWKKTAESKAQAKRVSIVMVGEEFLDDIGEVISSFKKQVKELMSSED
jgi:hypothetical protein